MAKSKSRKPAASLSGSLLEIKNFRPKTGTAAAAGDDRKPPATRSRRRAKVKARILKGPGAARFEAVDDGPAEKAAAAPETPEVYGTGTAPSAQIQFLFAEDATGDSRTQDREKPASEQFLENLRCGRFAEAEVVFGRLTGLEPKTVSKILYGKKFETLAIACRAIGFKPLEFTTILAILRGAKGDERLSNFDSLRDSLDFFNQFDRKDAIKVLDHLPRR